MTLQEVRKLYIGKKISKELLSECFSICSDEKGVHLHFESGDEMIYSATIALDNIDDMHITGISRLYCQRLLGEDASSSVYKSCQVSKDDYDILGDELEECVENGNRETKITDKFELGKVLDMFPDRHIYLFLENRLLGAVNSKSIGVISDTEKKIKVEKFTFCFETRPFSVHVYLEAENVPEKWKV